MQEASSQSRKTLQIVLACLVAAAIISAQVIYGGLMRTAFSVPCYTLIAIATTLGIFAVRQNHGPKLAQIILVLCLGSYLSWRTWVSNSPDLVLFYGLLILATLATYLLFASAITSYKARFALLSILAVVGVIQIIIAAQQFSVQNFWPLPWFSEQIRVWYQPNTTNIATSRGHGLYLNGNHLAWFLNFISFFALAIACLGRVPVWAKILAVYVGALSITGTLLTLSRGGTLGLCAGIITFIGICTASVFYGTTNRKTLSLTILVTLALTIGAGTYLLLSSPTIQARMSKISEDSYRSNLWPAAVKQAQIAPILGTGAGSFTQLSRRLKTEAYTADDTYAHNDWAQILADFGLVGLILTLGVVIFHLCTGISGTISALRSRMTIYCHPQSNTAALLLGATSCLVAFSVHSFFDFNMQISSNAILAAICCGIIANPGLARQRHARHHLLSQILLGLTGAGLVCIIYIYGPSEISSIKVENSMILGKLEDAQYLAQRSLDKAPGHVKLNGLMGEILLKQAYQQTTPVDALESAAYHLNKAAEADKDERWHQLMLGITLTRLGRFREAEKALRTATMLDPLNGSIYEHYGALYEAEKNIEAAKYMYNIAVQLPGSKFAREKLKELNIKNK